jgi:hypothetical protein
MISRLFASRRFFLHLWRYQTTAPQNRRKAATQAKIMITLIFDVGPVGISEVAAVDVDCEMLKLCDVTDGCPV